MNKLAALAFLLVSAVVGIVLAYWLRPPAAESEKSNGQGIPAHLFRDWGKPDFVLVLSGQQHGYMMPCGCSSPQLGGLERRYNFIQMLKARGWPVVAVDLGDVPQKRGPAKLPNVQGLIKYRYSMMALKEMGYLAVGVGEYEGALSLARVEGEWAVHFAQPAVLAANLLDAKNSFPHFKAVVTRTVPGANIKVGVTSVMTPRVAMAIKDPAVRTIPWDDSLRRQVKTMQEEKVDLPLLLYHGRLLEEDDGARRCAEMFPQFSVILCLSEGEDPSKPELLDDPQNGTHTYICRLGHKGKSVGVLGVYGNGPSFSFKYQLVEMRPEYATPPEQEANQPILKMMEDYTRELKNNNYLQEYDQSKQLADKLLKRVPGLRNPGDGVPTYIGSEACGKCHEYAYEVWKDSPHSHAYQTLVDAKHPSRRQYDGECIVCHTVGFGYKTGFTNEMDTPKLKNVGCESCHGPGSLHKRNPRNEEWQRRMDLLWSEADNKDDVKAHNRAIEKFCITCHDHDNDVTWFHDARGKKDPFVEKWEKGKIIHNTPDSP